MTMAAENLRRALSLIGFAALLGVSTSFASAAEWKRIGFEGEPINTLAIDPEATATIYAGTDKGLFKSTDGGSSWSAVLPTEPPLHKLYSVVINPADTKTLFALEYAFNGDGDAPDGLILRKSADAGATWEAVETDLRPGHFFNHMPNIAFEPKSSTLYLVGPELWASTNGGAHFERIADPGSPALTLLIDPDDTNILYLSTDNSDVYKSTDGGKTWTMLAAVEESPFTVSAVARHPTNPAILYAATAYGMRKSSDGGMRWDVVDEGIEYGSYNYAASAVAIDPAHPDTIYAGAAGRLYRSDNAGKNWTDAGAGLSDFGWVKQLVFDPKNPTILYAGTVKGLWKLEGEATKAN